MFIGLSFFAVQRATSGNLTKQHKTCQERHYLLCLPLTHLFFIMKARRRNKLIRPLIFSFSLSSIPCFLSSTHQNSKQMNGKANNKNNN